MPVCEYGTRPKSTAPALFYITVGDVETALTASLVWLLPGVQFWGAPKIYNTATI